MYDATQMNGMMPTPVSGQLTISKLEFDEVSGFEDQYRYSYQPNFTGDAVRLFSELTQNGTNVSRTSLGTHMGQYMTTQLERDFVLPISNGWGEKRFRFTLELTLSNRRMGSSVRQVITGYTDHVGVSQLSGEPKLDPNMKMHINNITVLRDQIEKGRKVTYIVDNDNLLVDTAMAEGAYTSLGQGGNDLSMRPTDVYSHGTVGETLSELNFDHQHGNIVNQRTGFAGGVKLSTKHNNSPGHYAARMINAYTQSHQDIEDVLNAGMGKLDSDAAAITTESTVMDQSFLNALRQVCGVNRTGFFAFKDLHEIDREGALMAGVINVNMDRSNGQSIYGTVSASWNEQNIQTFLAATIISTLPVIMQDSLLGIVSFTYTNMVVGSQYAMSFNENLIGSFIDGIDPFGRVGIFEQRFIHEMHNTLTRNGEIGVSVDIKCDIRGTTEIYIQVEDQPAVLYRSPTYADALLSPILTRNERVLTNLYTDFTRLSQHIEFNQPIETSSAPMQHPAPSYTPPAPNHGGNSGKYW